MNLRIAVTGTRFVPDVGHPARLNQIFSDILSPFCSNDTSWLLGGAAGIDTMVLLWLAARPRSGNLLVAVPARMEDQPEEAQRAIRLTGESRRLNQLLELRYSGGVGAEAFDVRNRWLVDHSNFVIGFPLTHTDDGSGTWATLNYARSANRPVATVPLGDDHNAHQR